jgi:hypothetical protein
MSPPSPPPKETKLKTQPSRAEKLAAALKRNLSRRKGVQPKK